MPRDKEYWDRHDEQELAAVRHRRERRTEQYERDSVAPREKKVNPERIEGAEEYGGWLHRQASQSQEQSAHLGMLQHEEKVLGGFRSSSLFRDRRPNHQDTAPSSAVVPEMPARRVNRTTGTCVNCGKSVEPGSGSIERGTEGYSTRHYPSCPTC